MGKNESDIYYRSFMFDELFINTFSLVKNSPL